MRILTGIFTGKLHRSSFRKNALNKKCSPSITVKTKETEADDRSFILKIDAKNHIKFFNQSWLDFAKENMGVDFAEIYIDQPLKKFIANPETWHIYEIAINQVRAETTGKIIWSFRCDSPECRRYMRMQITKDAEDFIEFKSHIEKQEARDPVLILNSQVSRTEEHLTICGWCKKVQLNADQWVEIEVAVEQLQLFDQTQLPQLTHSICPHCHQEVLKEIESRPAE